MGIQSASRFLSAQISKRPAFRANGSAIVLSNQAKPTTLHSATDPYPAMLSFMIAFLARHGFAAVARGAGLMTAETDAPGFRTFSGRDTRAVWRTPEGRC